MVTSNFVRASALRSRALTTILFEDVDEEGRHGFYGRVHLTRRQHPYCFVSRDIAARFARWLLEQHLCDGFELITPGTVPPARPSIIDLDDLPF